MSNLFELENLKQEINDLKAQVESLEMEKEEMIRICDRKSVQMTKVLQKNREYLNEIQELKDGHEKNQNERRGLISLLTDFISKNRNHIEEIRELKNINSKNQIEKKGLARLLYDFMSKN